MIDAEGNRLGNDDVVGLTDGDTDKLGPAVGCAVGTKGGTHTESHPEYHKLPSKLTAYDCLTFTAHTDIGLAIPASGVHPPP